MRSLIVVVLALVSVTASAVAEKPGHYESPYTSLEFDYELLNGTLSSFQIWTGHGVLAGTVERMDRLMAVELSMPSTGEAIQLRIAESFDPQIFNIGVFYGDAGETHYSYDSHSDEIEILASTLSSEHDLADAPITLAAQEARAEISADLQPLIGIGIDLPVHEVELLSLLTLVTAEPSPETRTNGCDECGTHACCSTCCDLSSHLATICQLTVLSIPSCWANPFCRTRAPAACEFAGALEVALCEVHNCTGLNGDPTCESPPDCVTAGGTCKVTCGGGWSSACGICPEGKRCCAP